MRCTRVSTSASPSASPRESAAAQLTPATPAPMMAKSRPAEAAIAAVAAAGPAE